MSALSGNGTMIELLLYFRPLSRGYFHDAIPLRAPLLHAAMET